jgi:hypothetical protein
MSEPKHGPFDDAIRILHEARGEAILVDEELMEVQLEAAIRVLEAAGKIHKDVCLREINTSTLVSPFEMLSESNVETTTYFDVYPRNEIRALLESLPDKE